MHESGGFFARGLLRGQRQKRKERRIRILTKREKKKKKKKKIRKERRTSIGSGRWPSIEYQNQIRNQAPNASPMAELWPQRKKLGTGSRGAAVAACIVRASGKFFQSGGLSETVGIAASGGTNGPRFFGTRRFCGAKKPFHLMD